MSREEGLDNDHPRKHIGELEGLPLRLRSAHYALMENFPGKFEPPTLQSRADCKQGSHLRPPLRRSLRQRIRRW
jgi:hypothetical protein